MRGTPFRVGDKIICLKNGAYPTPKSGVQTYACNGEIGRVVRVEKSFSDAQFDEQRIIRIYRSGEQATTRQFDLAYAVTCHKMQGSEIPVAIVALDDSFGAKQVCSREWIYTAISRAKRACLLIGSRQTADAMCRQVAIGKRKTFLKERIESE